MTRRDYLDDPAAPAATSIVVASTAFVRDEQGRVLLISRSDSGKWALPGGGQELGETVGDSAIRETREETGLDIEVTGLVGIYSNPRHVIAYDDGEVRQQFSICFRGRVVGGTVQTSDESPRVGWFRPDELAALDIHPEMRRRIERGLANEDQPYLG